MRSRIVVTDNTKSASSMFRSIARFVAAASGLALKGLGVAVAMGVIFGLVIGVGGAVMGVETARLYMIGGFSGWISSLVAMIFVFSQLRRNRHSGH